MSDQDELPPDVPDKLFYRIGEAAEIVGVEPHVLRYWEGEFKMRPTRSPSGQRMFKRKDLAKFLRIRKLLHDEGFTIAGARKALSEASAPSAAEPASATSSVNGSAALERIEAIRSQIARVRKEFSLRGPTGEQESR